MKTISKFLSSLLIAIPLIGNSKPLFIGDSLTYPLAISYKKIAPIDAKFLESTGLNSQTLLDWQNYINEIDLRSYDTIYIVLGTNDHIQKKDIHTYQLKIENFIKKIKQQNKNIVWVLPPTLENNQKNTLLNNTRTAIKAAANNQGIATIDMRKLLGMKYSEKIQGITVRTADGIHITAQGADLVVSELVRVRKI
ncbi:SGNH/GDSL hydrolase family protein [Xenorhabdus entomophaga]|uniref:SGNH/GDSL hydrolase family protein n=1 Tax=Xenorhabdus entomophaga TaxID=3136257 RepID=UPI0030F4557E